MSDRQQFLASRLGVEEFEVEPGDVDWDLIRSTDYDVRVQFGRAFLAQTVVQGECRVNGLMNTAEVFPVLNADGLHWECNHPDPHVSKVVAALGP